MGAARDINPFRTMLTSRGEMGGRVASLPWGETSLGEPDTWPQSLCSALDICLGLSSPAGLFWGPDFVFFYNDALRGLIGDNHPSGLGQHGPKVFLDIWPTIGPMLEKVRVTGEAVGNKGQFLSLHRSSANDDSSFDYTFNPIRHKDGSVAGIFMLAFDTTERVLAERALRDSELRYKGFAHATSNSLFRMSADGTQLLEVSGSVLRPHKPSADDSTIPFEDYIHPDDLEMARTAVMDAIRTETPCEMEVRGRRADGTFGWVLSRAVPMRDEHGRVAEWFGSAMDISKRMRALHSNEVLIAELQHRTRNLLAVVRSITRQILKSSTTPEEFAARLDDRLGALSRVQGLLSRPQDGAVSIDELVRMELRALGAEELDPRITVEGPPVPLPNNVVQTLALALHELSTNAVKYGALTTSQGHLYVTWHVCRGADDERHLTLNWVEHGIVLPPRKGGPTHRGYGRELIERALPYQLDARTNFELTDQKVSCSIDVPLKETGGERTSNVAAAT